MSLSRKKMVYKQSLQTYYHPTEGKKNKVREIISLVRNYTMKT